MNLPAHADISLQAIAAMAAEHGLPSSPIVRVPDRGIFNAVYLLGDEYVLRIPRRHPAHDRALYNESVAVPAARRAGVRTPDLLVYDASLRLLPAPYTVYERVHGETLGHLELEPYDVPNVWRDLGRDLASLHAGVPRDGPGGALGKRETLADPRELADRLASGGWITGREARWLICWLDRIAPQALARVEPRFSHGDTQADNIMVRSDSHQYAAVLDWGGASWGDPAWDFGGVPLGAVPYLLEGYRTVAPLEGDETAEARILWWHVQLALFNAHRGPQPSHSWAERPLTMLLEVTRFFLGDLSAPWSALRPD